VLVGVDAQAAMVRPVSNAHSIWEIVLHVSASVELVLSRLRGEASVLSPEEDWPLPQRCSYTAIADQHAWEADVCRLTEVHGELIEELATVDTSRLDAPIVPGFSSIYVTLHGLVQHNVYHAGQIALLKKAA
jgi:uncharacterized damage-inducible protein DinB